MYNQIIDLYHKSQMDIWEIANVLGVSVQTVRNAVNTEKIRMYYESLGIALSEVEDWEIMWIWKRSKINPFGLFNLKITLDNRKYIMYITYIKNKESYKTLWIRSFGSRKLGLYRRSNPNFQHWYCVLWNQLPFRGIGYK